MVVFWLIAAVMVVVALAFVMPPLLGIKRRQQPSDQRLQTNLLVYRERLAEVEAEHAAGDLDAAAFEEARRELQRELLHDTADVAAADHAAGDSGPSGASLVVAVAVAALLPMLGFGLYMQLGNPTSLDPEARMARAGEDVNATGGEPDAAAIEQMVAGLAARLAEQPEDGEGWLMLGRSYAVMGRHAAAAEAFSRAHDLLGETPDLLVDWAEAMGRAAGESLAGRPRELIDRALELQPDNAKALWLGGFAELQSENPALALRRWHQLRTLLPPDSEARTALDNMLAQLGAAAEPAPAAAAPAPAAASAVRIIAEVTLAPALAGRLQGNESLFVFARAAEGPRIPLAVVRASAADLPFTVTLDESQAMQPGMTIASVPQVIIGARITRNGQPTASSGDLQGFSAAVAPGTVDRVRVVIDQVVP